ncbi:MAG: methyltransferase family protein [Pikeienuella sp.]
MRRFLPPYLVLLSLAALATLRAWHPEGLTLRADRAMPWDIPLASGLIVLVWARAHFLRRGAEIMTFGEPRALVTDGPFRFSRNPMYLGFLLVLTGAAFFVNLWCALLAPLVFLLASAFWYIPFEERALRGRFGRSYDDYARRTRRWI